MGAQQRQLHQKKKKKKKQKTGSEKTARRVVGKHLLPRAAATKKRIRFDGVVFPRVARKVGGTPRCDGTRILLPYCFHYCFLFSFFIWGAFFFHLSRFFFTRT